MEDFARENEHTCQEYKIKSSVRRRVEAEFDDAGITCVQKSTVGTFNSAVANIEGAAGVAVFEEMQRQFRRYKQGNKVVVPVSSSAKTTVKEVADQLVNQNVITYPFYKEIKTFRCVPLTSVYKGKEYHHILMYDPEFVRNFSNEMWYMDSTFDACPNLNDATQLFTVMAVKDVVVKNQVVRIISHIE